MILCLDPGTKAAGVACFFDDSSLMSAWLAQGSCWYETADSIRSVVPGIVTQVVLERMEVYQSMEIPPAVLVTLSLMAGRVSALSLEPPVEYLPKKWKGQVPKKIHVARTKAQLSATELSLVEVPNNAKLASNVWDAVGIGLYHLRKQRRQYEKA